MQARPTYTSFWTGRLLDTASSDWLAAATGSAPLAAADGNKPTANISSLASPPKSDTQRVSIELHDVSEPVPGHPPFASEYAGRAGRVMRHGMQRTPYNMRWHATYNLEHGRMRASPVPIVLSLGTDARSRWHGRCDASVDCRGAVSAQRPMDF